MKNNNKMNKIEQCRVFKDSAPCTLFAHGVLRIPHLHPLQFLQLVITCEVLRILHLHTLLVP